MHVDPGTDFHLTSVKEPRAFWDLGVRSDQAVDRNREKTEKVLFLHKRSEWKEFWLNKRAQKKNEKSELLNELVSAVRK